jgi:hypothetical protein
MKTTVLTLLSILFIFSTGGLAQNSQNKIKAHKVWVTPMDGSKVIKGILYAADKDEVRLIDNNSFDISNLTIVKAQNIAQLKIRRKGKVGKGVWVGAATGFVVGGIIGFASGDDDPDQWFWSSTAEEKALGNGILLAIVGTGIGPLIASKKNKITIDGNKPRYESKLETIQSYALMRNVNEN